VRLVGRLPEWVSAKDVVLEMLRRHGVGGAVGRIIEYHGPGLETLSAMDRHVIANMGAELGATTTVFPADRTVRDFLRAQGRGADFTSITADSDARYDVEDEIDLSAVQPLIARPGSPGDVVPVREAAGADVHQVVIGSSANPGLRDFAVVAAALTNGHRVHPQVSLDVNPTTRQVLLQLTRSGASAALIQAGARIHQTGCMGCIGMGQAPAVGHNSLRTFPRNFPGRSGTKQDSVWLCSPETAAAAALTGRITDPRDLPGLFAISYPHLAEPESATVIDGQFEAPLPLEQARKVELEKAPSIGALPDLDPLPDELTVPVLMKVGDDVSTDEILPAGARALPYRSNIGKLADFTFTQLDEQYPQRARDTGAHAVVGGSNYGQGSSREHAAIAPRHLGLRLVLAKSYARIHHQNLANYGILPLEFADPSAYERIEQGDELAVADLRERLRRGGGIEIRNATRDETYQARHHLSDRQIAAILAGGQIPLIKERGAAGH
jgi:aconitate hydratase